MADGCGCTGIRKCLLCEENKKSNNMFADKRSKTTEKYEFCILCGETFLVGQECLHRKDIDDVNVKLKGITVIQNFINEIEEETIVADIEKTVWKPSQSGRRKQDFGPQVNFKKRKLKLNNFTGLPQFSKVLVERMWRTVPLLSDFQPVELCNLEYTPDRGSSIDPHFDDFWVWGERLVTVNLLSDSLLTFSVSGDTSNIEVSVPMPRRSLIIVRGPARYEWKHAIKRQDILSRRIAVTLRELAQDFCEGGKSYTVGHELIKTALSFQGESVQVSINKECEG
nr:alpha-ketoglutarate-dependent dioxygenase alkB homolog 4-like isoform X1 [Pocillopora verrucosa]